MPSIKSFADRTGRAANTALAEMNAELPVMAANATFQQSIVWPAVTPPSAASHWRLRHLAMVANSLRIIDLRQKLTIPVNMCYASPGATLTIRFANRWQVTETYQLRQTRPN
jgi:hypothetical protein